MKIIFYTIDPEEVFECLFVTEEEIKDFWNQILDPHWDDLRFIGVHSKFVIKTNRIIFAEVSEDTE
jgi:hypothetical protein